MLSLGRVCAYTDHCQTPLYECAAWAYLGESLTETGDDASELVLLVAFLRGADDQLRFVGARWRSLHDNEEPECKRCLR